MNERQENELVAILVSLTLVTVISSPLQRDLRRASSVVTRVRRGIGRLVARKPLQTS